MTENTDNNIQLFEDQAIRTAWDEEQEEWYFSIVDVVAVLTESENPRRYWSDLKRKMKKEEGAIQLYENIVQLKMKSSDGKFYKTDVATTEQLLRIIQSIPSPKAEPFKLWLAQVGRERIEETIDPEHKAAAGSHMNRPPFFSSFRYRAPAPCTGPELSQSLRP